MTAGALLTIVALGFALALAGCGASGLDGPDGRPVALTVAVPAPMRGALTPIVRSVDPRALVVAVAPRAGVAARADVVVAIPATDLVAQPGLMPAGFNHDSYMGELATSVVAFGVRPGNPQRIHGWRDLLRRRLRVVMTDPLGADGGRLEVLSAATAIFVARHHNRFAQAYVRRLLTRAIVAPTEAGAITRFATGGAGVVVATEDRLLTARDRGVALQIVYPSGPAPIVLAIAVGRLSAHPGAAQALVDALRQPGPQRALARAGLRPVLVGYAPPDRFPMFGLARSPAILGSQQLVARSYFGPIGIAKVAQRRRRQRQAAGR